MLVFPINAKSVQDSNIFLRKLWSELNQVKPMGWNMYPHKSGTKVTIGKSNLGEISFDYNQRGCIKNLYIDSDTNADDISAAVHRANSGSMKLYSVTFELKGDKDISIEGVSIGGCSVFSRNGTTYLQLNFEAYSTWDIKTFLPNKYEPILSILYEYTQTMFDIVRIKYSVGGSPSTDTAAQEYNYRWIDFDECPRSENKSLILAKECLQLISYIMDDKIYDEDIELLLNSSRVLMTTKRLLKEVSFPNSSGKADIINSMVCSSFEPLSMILDKHNSRCEKCGNMIFSITHKIKEMCTRYFDEPFSKYVCNVIYKNRSAFLHMGKQESDQRSGEVHCPQINADTGIVMMPHGAVNYVAFDYSSYLFRNIAHDYFHKEN